MKLMPGCMAFLVDNPFPFCVKVFVNDQCKDGLWDCVLLSEIHHYQPVFLEGWQLSRITQEDELVVELYEKGL